MLENLYFSLGKKVIFRVQFSWNIARIHSSVETAHCRRRCLAGVRKHMGMRPCFYPMTCILNEYTHQTFCNSGTSQPCRNDPFPHTSLSASIISHGIKPSLTPTPFHANFQNVIPALIAIKFMFNTETFKYLQCDNSTHDLISKSKKKSTGKLWWHMLCSTLHSLQKPVQSKLLLALQGTILGIKL